MEKRITQNTLVRKTPPQDGAIEKHQAQQLRIRRTFPKTVADDLRGFLIESVDGHKWSMVFSSGLV
jgi:hypothetical protein